MNSFSGVHIFQSQSVVVLVGKALDNSARADRRRSLAQGHRQTTDLLAFAAQKNIPNRTDLYLCARLSVLLKLERIVLNGQYSAAVSPRVCESQQMSRPSAEWYARVP